MATNSIIYDSLAIIHKSVLHNFTYKTDLEQYACDEKWVMPPITFSVKTKINGDCEDFALACRKLCRESTPVILPTRLVVCTIAGSGHCVLECMGWILCCNQVSVMSRDDLHLHQEYDWRYISGYNPGDPWHTIVG